MKSTKEEGSQKEEVIQYSQPNSNLDEYTMDYDLQMKKIQELSTPILESVTADYLKNFTYFKERYFEDRYFVNFTNTSKRKTYDDVLVRIHTNKILLIAVASGHTIMSEDKDIVEISFIINKTDRSNIKISGKRKLGAKELEPHTILCQVRLDGDPTMYNIRAGVRGYLVEINELVKTQPNLLKTDPKGNGFLAIMMPRGPISELERNVNNLDLINEDVYLEYIAKRTVTDQSVQVGEIEFQFSVRGRQTYYVFNIMRKIVKAVKPFDRILGLW